MALVMLREEYIKEHPNILWVMQCYFDDIEEVCQQGGRIFYRVQGEGLTDKDNFVTMTIDNTDNFLQIVGV